MRSEPTEALGLDIVVHWGGGTQLSEERLGTVHPGLASRPSKPVASAWLVGPGRLVRHSRWLISQSSEVSVPRRLFEGVLDRVGRLSSAPS